MSTRKDIKRETELGLPAKQIELPANVLQLFETVSAMSNSSLYMIGSTVLSLLQGKALASDIDFLGEYNLDDLSQTCGSQVILYDTEAEVLKIQVGNNVVDLIQSGSVIEALWWRDITTSLLVLDANGNIYDPLNALNDIQKHQIRMVDPIRKVKDDPSRLLRVLRFAVQLGFDIEESTCRVVSDCDSWPTYDQRIRSELDRILAMSPRDRVGILQLAQRIGVGMQLRNLLMEYGRHLLVSNQRLEEQINLLKRYLGLESGYVFGGAIRDILMGREFRDIDIKLKINTDEFIRMLESIGFVATDDVELPQRTYYYNKRFNAVSIRIGERVFDFTQFHVTDDDEWYIQSDINFNSVMCDFAREIVINERRVPEIILGLLRLVSPELTDTWDPLHIVNYLKQVSRNGNLYLEEADIYFIRVALPFVFKYFQANQRMLYKLEGLLGNPNSDFVLGIIKETEEGRNLLEMLQIYLLGEP